MHVYVYIYNYIYIYVYAYIYIYSFWMNAWTGTSTGVSSAGTVSAALSNPNGKKPGIPLYKRFQEIPHRPSWSQKKKPSGPTRRPSWQVDEQPCGPSFPKSHFCVPGAWLSTMSCKGCRSAQEVQFNLHVASALANHPHLMELGYPFLWWCDACWFRYSSWLPKSKQKLTIKTKIDAPKRPLTSLFSSLLCAAGLLLCRCPAPSAVLWVLEWSALQFFYQPRCFWIQFSVHLQLVSCRLFAG